MRSRRCSGKPAEYAQFLGVELGLWYVGPLLVVMPAGFGVYDGGRSTAPEQQVLRSPRRRRGEARTTSPAARPPRCSASTAAGALDSPDISAPLVTAHPATATRGKPATLRFDLFDDSGRSKAFVRVYENALLLATLSSPMAFAIGTAQRRRSLAGAEEATQPAAPLLRRRHRPVREPQQARLRTIPPCQLHKLRQ